MSHIDKYLTKCPECSFKAFLINRVIECPDCGCMIEDHSLNEAKDESLDGVDEYDLDDVGIIDEISTKQLNKGYDNE